jgi:hypothetical protein
MANEFVARKGLISSGSINVSGSVTASFFKGDGSQLTNISAQSATVTVDAYYFTSSGAQTEFLLDAPYNINSLFVVVDGLSFNAATDYIISSSTVVFTSAPPSESIIAITALANVTENATGSFFGSFIGNGAGLTDIRTALTIDTHQFVGNGSTFEYVLSQSYAPNALLISVEGINFGLNTDFTISGSTLTFVDTPPSQSNIIVNAFISVSSGSIGTFSGSFLGNATTATTASFAANVFKTKAGEITNTSFGGTPLTASVAFATAFDTTNYSIAVTGEDSRAWIVESKTASGFIVNSVSNTTLTGTTYWTCTAHGEN